MEPKIQIFEDAQFRVRCYLDANDVARLHVEDVARSLGWIMTRKERVTTIGDNIAESGDNIAESGDNIAESGDNIYTAIRWERVNKYIAEIKEHAESELIKAVSVPVDKNAYIPENLVYRLAMKANNECAEKFQALLADVILPSIRKTGKYVSPNAVAIFDAAADTLSLEKKIEFLLRGAALTNLDRLRNQLIREAALIATGKNLV
ncbi:MAG: hypothetical protein J5809_04870 [Selenomonadaceae bacterium]|nr:hypothetical protein [Selenomonadaceae bacterium]